MVGYWQSMQTYDVLAEVHDELRKKPLPDLVLILFYRRNQLAWQRQRRLPGSCHRASNCRLHKTSARDRVLH